VGMLGLGPGFMLRFGLLLVTGLLIGGGIYALVLSGGGC
jgi:hypothetical protein